MASLRKIASRAPTPESHFAFGSQNPSDVGEPVFHWDGKEWHYVGRNEVWVMPPDFQMVTDPIAEIITVKTGKQPGSKACTKKGDSFHLPQAKVFERTHNTRIYVVFSYLSVYEVWIGVSKYNVLGFYGYCDADKSAMIFTVNGGGITHGATLVNGSVIFDEPKQERQTASPAYSAPPVIQTGPKTAGQLAEELKSFRSRKSIIAKEVLTENPDLGPELAENVVGAMELGIERALTEKISPTAQQLVVHIEVSDEQLRKVMRRKSSVEKMLKGKGTTPVVLFDPVAEGRKQLKLGPKDPFPMPINVKKAEDKGSPVLKLPMPGPAKVDGEELL